MELADCFSCVEKYNRSTRAPISCDYCQFTCCKECYKKFLLSQTEAHCMNCKRAWDRYILLQYFGSSWIDSVYKEHREQTLLERERSLLPATQPEVERVILNEKIDDQIRDYKQQIRDLRQKIHETEGTIYHLIEQKTNRTTTERQQFIRKCPKEDCRGFLSTQWKCGLCEHYTCPDCHELLGKSRNDEEHKCDPAHIETAKFLAKDTKSCPGCGTGIFKIEGCFAENTPILLWDGSSKMSQDICVDDILVGDDGKQRKVLTLMNGEDDMYEVIQNNGMRYVVNSRHTMVFKNENNDYIEIIVEEYMKSTDEYKNSLYGFKSSNDKTNVKINYIGKGNYYGWAVDGNKRFLLEDFTVVRNCSQMFCTQCHTVFDWKTGRIETGQIHNPHYFEYMKRNGQLQRNPQEIRCGREVDNYFTNQFSALMRRESLDRRIMHDLTLRCRCLIHIRWVELPRWQVHRNNENLYLRVLYLRNKITEEEFKRTLQRKEKENLKKQEIYNILQMFLECSTEIFYRFMEYLQTGKDRQNDEMDVFKEFEGLREYSNNCLGRVSKAYKCRRYSIDVDFNFI